MSMFDWAVLGAAALAIMMFCARMMRRGLTTLDQDRQRFFGRLEEGKRQLAEDRKKMPAAEHLEVMRAAMDDLLRLDDNPAGFAIMADGKKITLQTPKGAWEVELLMRERNLASAKKVLHGKSRWLLSGFNQKEYHNDPASLMKSLNEHLRGEGLEAPGIRPVKQAEEASPAARYVSGEDIFNKSYWKED